MRFYVLSETETEQNEEQIFLEISELEPKEQNLFILRKSP